MAQHWGPRIPTNGLVLALDAANPKSYPGTGTTWFDLCGNFDFTLSSASAWVENGGKGKQYMDFESYTSKYLPGGSIANVTHYNEATICILSELKTPDGDWKTLIRGLQPDWDHQVIVSSSDGISLGMYDNDGGNFQDTGFNMNTLPNYSSQMNFMAWKFSSTVSPYYQFFYNDNLSTAQATLTGANSKWEHGFASIGGYHSNTSTMSTYSQEWGKIAIFLYYNRHLSTHELTQVYNALKGRFDL
jgi:hypothetical protein